jgi:hypothetical protein
MRASHAARTTAPDTSHTTRAAIANARPCMKIVYAVSTPTATIVAISRVVENPPHAPRNVRRRRRLERRNQSRAPVASALAARHRALVAVDCVATRRLESFDAIVARDRLESRRRRHRRCRRCPTPTNATQCRPTTTNTTRLPPLLSTDGMCVVSRSIQCCTRSDTCVRRFVW